MRASTNRGILYVMIAVLTYLQSALKDTMTQHDWIMLVLGAILAGAVTLRAFIDQTPTSDHPQPVVVTNTNADPVKTEEATTPVSGRPPLPPPTAPQPRAI